MTDFVTAEERRVSAVVAGVTLALGFVCVALGLYLWFTNRGEFWHGALLGVISGGLIPFGFSALLVADGYPKRQ